MPLLPVNTTRTSTPLTNQRLLFQLNNDQLALQRQYDQLSTGQRVLRLSDDPAAAGRAIQLNRGIDRSTQLIRNTNSTANFYQGADTALARVDSALIQARGAAVEGAQGVISDDERAALATTIQESIDSVFAAGNNVFRDHQLLGGFLNTDSAFVYDGNDIVFQGSDESRSRNSHGNQCQCNRIDRSVRRIPGRRSVERVAERKFTAGRFTPRRRRVTRRDSAVGRWKFRNR
jgi:flagellar hook-associated protein 3 FlgL